MIRLLSFLKIFTAVTLLFLFFQTGSGRELIMRTPKGFDHVATNSHRFQESRKVMLLDYEDAGPNINNRSGFTPADEQPPKTRD